MVFMHSTDSTANAKLGAGGASYRDRGSCPDGRNGTVRCPAWDICYGKGRIEAIGKRYGTDDAEVANNRIRAMAGTLPQGAIFRANVVGDFLRDGALDTDYVAAIADLSAARPDVTIIAYTHAWATLSPADFPFTVNASCDSADDVARARAAGWPTVRVIATDDAWTDGGKTVQCPAQSMPNVTCATCRLCARGKRAATVGFAAHGIAAKGKNLAAYTSR